MSDITSEETETAVTEMKSKKSSGEDGAPVEAIKLGGDTIYRFVKCMSRIGKQSSINTLAPAKVT